MAEEQPVLVTTPRLQLALRILTADHRELVAMIDEALAADPHLVQHEPPAAVGTADLALALEPDRAWAEVAFWGRYETTDGANRDTVFLIRGMERRAETVARVVQALAEHHRPRLEHAGATEPMRAGDLGEAVGVHPSTTIRVLTGKVVRFEGAHHPLAELLPFRQR